MDKKVFALSVLLLLSCLGTTYQAAVSDDETDEVEERGDYDDEGDDISEKAATQTNAKRLRTIIRSNEPVVRPQNPVEAVMRMELSPQTFVDKYLKPDGDGGERSGGRGGGRGGTTSPSVDGTTRSPDIVPWIGALSGAAGGGGNGEDEDAEELDTMA